MKIGTDVDPKRQLLWDFYVKDGYGTLTAGGLSASFLAFSLLMAGHAGWQRLVEAHHESGGITTMTLAMMAIFGAGGILATAEMYGRNAVREMKQLHELRNVRV